MNWLGWLKRRPERRQSIEDPATSLSALWLEEPGETVPLKFGPVWRAVNLISGDVAKLPLVMYRRSAGGKERATDHPAYQLCRYMPNPHMTAFVFRQTMQAHAMLRGNAYARIERDDRGRPLALWPLDPAKVAPLRAGGELYYSYQQPDLSYVVLDRDSVLHVRGLGFDGLQGYSVIKLFAESLGMGVGAMSYNRAFFANGAKPSMILEHPGTLSDTALKAIRNQVEAMHAGAKNAHRVMITEEGMKASPFSTNAADAQLIESLKFSLVDMANWFGLPPHKLGDATRAGYNSLEQENQSYLDEGLDRWLVTWEEECRAKLLSGEELAADSIVVEFKRQALVRSDLRTRAEYYRQALGGAPWATINEVRQLENMNDLDDPKAAALQMPRNNFGDAPPTQSQRDAAAAAMADARARAVKRLTVHAGKAKDAAEFWRSVHVAHGDALRAILGPAVQMAEAVSGDTDTMGATIQSIIDEVRHA